MKNIGAPNSIARYVSETTWGGNRYAVMEYENGKPVCRAASPSASVRRYMQEGRFLIELATYFPEMANECEQPEPDTCHECGELAVGYEDGITPKCAKCYQGKRAFWETAK